MEVSMANERCRICGEFIDYTNIHYSGHTCDTDRLNRLGSNVRFISGVLEDYKPKECCSSICTECYPEGYKVEEEVEEEETTEEVVRRVVKEELADLLERFAEILRRE
jgi:hypothetical protein